MDAKRTHDDLVKMEEDYVEQLKKRQAEVQQLTDQINKLK